MSIAPLERSQAIPFVVCRKCKVAVTAAESRYHLLRRHSGITLGEAVAIQKRVYEIPGIVTNADEISTWEFPSPTAGAVPELEEPQSDGFACNECQFISRAVVKMQKHCRVSHGWVNDWAVGGDMRTKTKIPRVFPWRENVRCQRLQRGGRGRASAWFEVERPVSSKQASSAHGEDKARLHLSNQESRKRDRSVRANTNSVDQAKRRKVIGHIASQSG